MRSVWMVMFGLGLATATTPVMAAAPALDFSLGFGGATLDDSFPEIDNTLNSRFNLTYSFAPFESEQRFRLGFGFSIEGAEERGHSTDSHHHHHHYSERPYAQVFAFTPEVRVAWSQPLGERWFIEPNVALTVPIAYYSVGEVESDHYYYDYYDESDDQTRVGIGVRPGLMIGYRLAPRHAIGLDMTYLFSTIDFRDVGPDYEAYSIGVFYRLSF